MAAGGDQGKHGGGAEVLADVSLALAATRDVAVVLDTVATQVARHVGDICAVMLSRPGEVEWDVPYVRGRDPEAAALFDRLIRERPRRLDDPGPVREAVRTGRPYVVAGIDLDVFRRELPVEYHPFLDQYPPRSQVWVPIHLRGETIGQLMCLRHATPDAYDDRDVELLVDVAERAAFAIENARLYHDLDEQVVERTSALSTALIRERLIAELARDVAGAASTVDDVLATTVRRAAEVIGDFCTIRLVSDDGAWLETPTFADRDADAEAFYGELLDGSRQPADEGISGQVVTSGEPLILREVDPIAMRTRLSSWAHGLLDRYDHRSVMIVPLSAQGHTIGVIGISRRAPGEPYQDEDLAFLTAIAGQAATAIAAARLHERLATSETQYRTLVENATDLIARFDRDGRQVFANLAWATMARSCACSAPATWRPPGLSDEVLDRVLTTASPVAVEHATADGSRWFETRALPELEHDGKVRSVLVTSRNITERRDAEEARRASEQSYRAAVADLESARTQLQSALDIGDIGLWVEDIERREVRVDETLLGFFGLTPGEEGADREGLLARLNPEDLPEARAAMAQMRSEGGTVELVTRITSLSGDTRWLWWKGRTDVDPSGQPVRITAVLRDITDERVADEARVRSQKLEALGTLAGGIAHDFNNVLAAIIGLTAIARGQISADHPVQHELDGIEKASNRAADLVRRILSFSRLSEPQRETLLLQPVIEEARSLLRASLPAHIGISADLAPATPTVSADTGQLTQVVLNLMTNAAHAIGDSRGTIWVRTSLHEVGPFEHNTVPPGRYAAISVSDDGCGMSPELVEHIFDPFFTTRDPGVGTGLGLSVVDGIVRKHGGVITVDSHLGRGTTITIYLPAADEPASTPPPRPTAPRSQGERVLFVDDEAMLVDLARRQLATLGYEVDGFTDAELALEAFRSHPGRYDVVITDLTMPTLSGLELARSLRAVRADVPIVLLSGYVESTGTGAAPPDVDLSLPKPTSLDELASALATVIRHG